MNSGTNSGGELLVELDRSARIPLRAQLEDGLRRAVRPGRLAAHTRLPASRAMAADLGVSRRLVVDAYAQLRPRHDGLVLGYASLSESGIAEGVRRLALALEECAGGAARSGAQAVA